MTQNTSITGLQIVYRAPDGLKAYAHNSRVHTDEQVELIAASINEFGFNSPILIDADGEIIAGHGRQMAAMHLKMDKVPTITLPHLTPEQKRTFLLADNKLTELGGWDVKILSEELERLQADGVDLTLTGFDTNELIELLDKMPPPPKAKKTEEDDQPEPPRDPVTQKGDVWLLGEHHRLLCGDSTSARDVKTLMAGRMADLVWTDPPYNVAVEGKAGTIMNDNMSARKFREFLQKVYDNYYAYMRPGAVIYVAHSESERAAFTDGMVKAGLKMSQNLIWVKQSATLSRQDFNWQHEPILYGWKEGQGHYWCGDFTRTTVISDEVDLKGLKRAELVKMVEELRNELRTTVIRADRPSKSDLHPTMKPVSLVETMLKWSSKSGDLVLDLFGGSGTTLIAAEKTGRKAHLMELDPKFADVICQRYLDYTEVDPIRQSDGAKFSELRATQNL